MGRKMKSAPVYFTIAQVRFNPILALDSYAAQIQEKLRKEGFPDVQKGFLATLNLNLSLAAPIDESAPQLPLARTVRFMFGNMERTSAFILDPSALSFQTTNYDVFETFSADFLKGLQAVEEAVKLSYMDRIGLRYLDAVYPKSGETLRDYLGESVLGLAEKLPDSVVQAFSETLIKVDSVNVRSRVVIQAGELGFPPDLQPMTLNLPDRFRELKGHHAIIDTDGWYDSRETFNLERIRAQLIKIHEGIEKTFRASVTDTALKVWE
jgi:uncharacterized protein (TIGR04255 family)